MTRRPILASVCLLALVLCCLPAANAYAAPAKPTPVRAASNAGGGAVVVRHGVRVSLSPAKGPAAAKPAAVVPHALGKYVGYYGPVTLNPGDWGDGWVSCPSGTLATGGGESNASVGGITIHDTYAMAGGSGWDVRITSNITAPTSVTFYVVCYSGLTSYHQETNKNLVGANSTAALTSSCLSGDQVLGGGGSSDTTNTQVGTYKAGSVYQGWAFSVRNFAATAQGMTAQAVCGNGFTTYRFIESDYTTIAPGAQNKAVVSCPAGTRLLGGGGAGTARLTDSAPDGDGWLVFAQNDSQQNEVVLSAAMCAS